MVHEAFSSQGMMKTLDAEIFSISAGKCSIGAPIGPAITQQNGFAHAAASFAIGDVACGCAALSTLDVGYGVLTSEMKIHLLAPAQGKRLIANAEVIRAGRRLVVTRADVMAEAEDGAQTHVATLLGTIVPMAPKP